MPRDERKAGLREIKRLNNKDLVASTVLRAERHLAVYPRHGVVWVYYSDALCGMARYSEALVALRRGARLCPSDKLHLIYYRYGHLHRQRGAFRLAERWYRKAVEVNPSDATYLVFLGAMLTVAGRLPEAEAVHRQATQCKEGYIDEAFLNLGLVLRALGRFAEARDCFKRALEIDPKYKEVREKLSDVEYVLKNHLNF